jgi:hypothetical protein
VVHLINAEIIILPIYRVNTKSRNVSADVHFGILLIIAFHASAKSDAQTQQTSYGY